MPAGEVFRIFAVHRMEGRVTELKRELAQSTAEDRPRLLARLRGVEAYLAELRQEPQECPDPSEPPLLGTGVARTRSPRATRH
jgi:hypothetical protein